MSALHNMYGSRSAGRALATRGDVAMMTRGRREVDRGDVVGKDLLHLIKQTLPLDGVAVAICAVISTSMRASHAVAGAG